MYDCTCPCPNDGPLKDAGIPKLRCALGWCQDCPKLKQLPYEKLKFGDARLENCDFITCRKYDSINHCRVHGCIGKSSVCQTCIDKPDEKPDKDPSRKIELVRKHKPMGNFHEEILAPMVETWRYHKFKMPVQGKHWCKRSHQENYHKVPAVSPGSAIMPIAWESNVLDIRNRMR